jgi:hypothetical protein
MQFFRIGLLCSALAVVALAQSDIRPTITVKPLPPESIPTGTCTSDLIGYIGILKDGKAQTNLTDKQLGEYVRVRLSEGYSVTLYPQASGKIFAIATCESAKH